MTTAVRVSKAGLPLHCAACSSGTALRRSNISSSSKCNMAHLTILVHGQHPALDGTLRRPCQHNIVPLKSCSQMKQSLRRLTSTLSHANGGQQGIYGVKA